MIYILLITSPKNDAEGCSYSVCGESVFWKRPLNAAARSLRKTFSESSNVAAFTFTFFLRKKLRWFVLGGDDFERRIVIRRKE